MSLSCMVAACGPTAKDGDDSAFDEGGSGGNGGDGGKASGGSAGKSGGTGGKASGGSGGSAGTEGKASGGSGGNASGGAGGSGAGGAGGNMSGGAGQGGGGGGGAGGMAAAGAAGMPSENLPLVYDFETDAEGWRLTLESANAPMAPMNDAGAGTDAGAVSFLSPPVKSNDKALTGAGSLRFDVAGQAGVKKVVYVGVQGLGSVVGIERPITKVTYNLWVPADSAITFVQAYVIGFDQNNWRSAIKLPTPGAWTQYELKFSTAYPVNTNGISVGFQLVTESAWSGSVYIDAVKVEFQMP